MSFNFSPRTVRDGLVLYLDAANTRSYVSGSTQWNDLKNNNVSGNLINAPTFNKANCGSILFDGVNDYVQNQPIDSLSATSYTISSWFKPISSTTGFATLLGYSSSRRLLWNSGSNSMLAQMGGGGANSTANSVPANQWCYVTFVYDMSLGKEYWYINGVYNAIANNASSSFNSTFYLGFYGDPSFYLLNGNISIVQIYNKRLSDLEIIQNFNATKKRYQF